MADAEARSGLIPSYVRDRNMAAERAGLEVGLAFKDEGWVHSTWIGSSAQFEASGMRLDNGRTWRPPSARNWLVSPFFNAECCREGEDVFSLLMSDEMPVKQFQWRGISVLEFEQESRSWVSTSYHATAAELVEAGIMKRLTCAPPGQASGRFITRRSGYDGDICSWECELCFDGKVVFTKDEYTEALRQRRQALRQSTEGAVAGEREEKRIERTLQARTMAAAKQDEAFQRFMSRLHPGGMR